MSELQKKSAPIVTAISEGDRVTIGATHQVRIDGSDSWVKVEVNSAVRANESPSDAFDRIGGTIADLIVNEIERQAGVIASANAAQRSIK